MSNTVLNKLIVLNSNKARCSSITHNLIVDKDKKYKVTKNNCTVIDKLAPCTKKIKRFNRLIIWTDFLKDDSTLSSSVIENIKRCRVITEEFPDGKTIDNYTMSILPEVTSVAFKSEPNPFFQISIVLYNSKAANVNISDSVMELTDKGLTIHWNKKKSIDSGHGPTSLKTDIAHFENNFKKVKVAGTIAITSSRANNSATVSLSFHTDIIRSNTIKITALPYTLTFDTLFGNTDTNTIYEGIDLSNLYRLQYNTADFTYQGSIKEVSHESTEKCDETRNPSKKRKWSGTEKSNKKSKMSFVKEVTNKLKAVKQELKQNLVRKTQKKSEIVETQKKSETVELELEPQMCLIPMPDIPEMTSSDEECLAPPVLNLQKYIKSREPEIEFNTRL